MIREELEPIVRAHVACVLATPLGVDQFLHLLVVGWVRRAIQETGIKRVGVFLGCRAEFALAVDMDVIGSGKLTQLEFACRANAVCVGRLSGTCQRLLSTCRRLLGTCRRLLGA